MENIKVKDYERISVLGSGAFGIVSLWKHRLSEEFIAIKRCKLQSVTEKQRERWENEVNFMKEIRNDNIVSFKILPKLFEQELNKHIPSGLPLLPMEYCSKGNLRKFLLAPQNCCGLPEIEIRYFLSDMCNALSFLHHLNIAHRDFKPENIVLQTCKDRQTNTLYKLIDLGYAKTLTGVMSLVGTLSYLAPEMFEGKNYTLSIDYWSFGIVVYEVMCGFHPFLHGRPDGERLNCIRKKPFDCICIYPESDGSKHSFSNTMVQNTHVSGILKQKLEAWLRLALEYDYKKRGHSVENGIDFFDRLEILLKSQIIKVFSVENLEYYCYEISDTTTFSTLQKLVENDTKIEAKEQIMYSDQGIIRGDENMLVTTKLHQGSVVYLFRRGSFVKGDLCKKSNLPFLKELMIAKRFNKELYSQAIFFVENEKSRVDALCEACILQYNYVQQIFNGLRLNFDNLKRRWSKLLFLVYHNSLKNNSESMNEKQLITYKEAIKEIGKIPKEMILLTRRCKRAESFKETLSKKHTNSLPNLRGYLDDVFRDALRNFQYGSTEPKGNIPTMFELIKSTIKHKDTILNQSEEMKTYGKLSGCLLDELEVLNGWVNDLEVNLEIAKGIIESPDTKNYSNLSIELHSSNFCENQSENCDTDVLIKTNKILSSQLQAAFDKILAMHKTLNNQDF